ncbi:MAG: ABC transporter permease subunit, partial [Candidatus Bathyarchaeia archaeon]
TIAQASLVISTAILTEASLSFVGLGLPPPLPSLGTMIASDREFMLQAPWVVIFPGVILTLLVVGVNFLGDRLRDVLDPKLRGSRW